MKPSVAASSHSKMKLLKGTVEKLNEWDSKGYNIILVTGRKESMRKQTIEQLSDAGIIYDQLIMGIGGGSRVLINDFKKDSDVPTATVALRVDLEKKDHPAAFASETLE